MGLTAINGAKIERINPPKNGIGYQVVIKIEDGWYRALYFNGLKKLKDWAIADNVCVSVENSLTYVSGFHIFKNLEDAKEYLKEMDNYNTRVVRVRYKGGRLEGYQAYRKERDKVLRMYPTIVADEIFIIREV